MTLAYLLDENERGLLWRGLQRHNALGIDPLDVLRVGDFGELPLGSIDPTILLWAEANNRILISNDKKTLPGYLLQHLTDGRHSPGIFILQQHAGIPALLEFLVEAAYASVANEWQDRIEYIP